MARNGRWAVIANFGEAKIRVEHPAPETLGEGWELLDACPTKKEAGVQLKAQRHLKAEGPIAEAIMAPPE